MCLLKALGPFCKYAGLFICLCVAGATGATMGIIGEKCLPNNRCLSPNSQICDTLEDKCKIRNTFNCAKDPDQCVSGASCQNNKCVCNQNSKQEDNGLCSPLPRKVGGECNTRDSQPCDDANAACTSSGSGTDTCQCRGSFTEDYQHYSCATPKRKVTGSCDASEEQPCEDLNAECIGSPATCHCRTDFVINSWDLSCELDVDKDCTGREDNCGVGTTCDPSNSRCRVGDNKSCKNHTDKCVAGARCVKREDSIAICSCIPDIYMVNVTTGTCYPAAGKVSGSCDVDDIKPCDDVNAVCSASSLTCVCKEGSSVNAMTLSCVSTASYCIASLLLLLSSVSWQILSVHRIFGHVSGK